jgi:hypothetical protein
MLGSRLGGFTDPRGSPRFSGMCCIPGSIRDGGIAGAPDSDGLSGVIPGAGSPPPSGGAGGSTSAATANAGRRVRTVMATSRYRFTGHLLVGSEREPYRSDAVRPRHTYLDIRDDMVCPVRVRITDVCLRTPYGHRDRDRLCLPLGIEMNKILFPVRPDTYSAGAHMVFPPWCASSFRSRS